MITLTKEQFGMIAAAILDNKINADKMNKKFEYISKDYITKFKQSLECLTRENAEILFHKVEGRSIQDKMTDHMMLAVYMLAWHDTQCAMCLDLGFFRNQQEGDSNGSK